MIVSSATRKYSWVIILINSFPWPVIQEYFWFLVSQTKILKKMRIKPARFFQLLTYVRPTFNIMLIKGGSWARVTGLSCATFTNFRYYQLPFLTLQYSWATLSYATVYAMIRYVTLRYTLRCALWYRTQRYATICDISSY